MKKSLSILLSIGILLLSVPAFASSLIASEEIAALSDEAYEAAYASEPASQRAIHIGYDGGLCQAAIPIAQEKGFFAAEGLTTELTRSESARDALAAGKLDTSAGMIAAWLVPIRNGVDIVFTVGLHTGCASAVVLADSDIQSFDDVKGGNIAITGGIGGVYHNIGYRFVAHDGFKATDFQWRDFPADQLLLVLQRDEAKAAILSDQIAENWVQEGSVRRIRSLALDDDFVRESCCVLGISGQFLRENPVASDKIARAVYNASVWIQESEENRKEAAQILLDNGHISGTVEYALSLLNLYQFGLDNSITEKSLYDSVDEYKALGVLDAETDPDALKEQIWWAPDLSRGN
ncbi:MAG: ABC transporter substrate-binding protein [Oscillospiraceae bacterium]|jgi:NitT/TauT family transport system substrate-binding protein|nr:ABC transporter substrate-binding protein [Oscillospiraceae bacterium]